MPIYRVGLTSNPELPLACLCPTKITGLSHYVLMIEKTDTELTAEVSQDGSNGSTGPEAFEPQSLTNETILNLASRVEVREEPEFTAMLPDRRPARITVHLADGQTLANTVYHSQGDPAEPISHERLVTKYFDLAEPALGKEKAQRALEMIQTLEHLENIQPLMLELRSVN